MGEGESDRWVEGDGWMRVRVTGRWRVRVTGG